MFGCRITTQLERKKRDGNNKKRPNVQGVRIRGTCSGGAQIPLFQHSKARLITLVYTSPHLRLKVFH